MVITAAGGFLGIIRCLRSQFVGEGPTASGFLLFLPPDKQRKTVVLYQFCIWQIPRSAILRTVVLNRSGLFHRIMPPGSSLRTSDRSI
jgi:hypothetical protein